MVSLNMKDRLEEGVRNLMKQLEDSEAVIVADKEGLPVVFETRYSLDIVDKVAALTAMLVGVSTKVSSLMNTGDFEGLEMINLSSRLFVYRIDEDLFLSILTPRETNVGLVHLALKEFFKNVKGGGS